MQIFVLLALGLTCSAVAEPSLTVDTSNGPIIGHLSSEYEEVIEYLGIPYAQPPVGELRFEAPRELQGKEKHIARNYVRTNIKSGPSLADMDRDCELVYFTDLITTNIPP